MRKARRVSVAACGFLVLASAPAAVATAPAEPASPTTTPASVDAPSSFSFRVENPGRSELSTSATAITCDALVESPHYSTGARSVIGKVRVHCHGGSGTLAITVKGSLGSVSGGRCSPNTVALGPPLPRWSGTSGTQQVTSNGATKTYYLPPVGGPKFAFNASWYDSATSYYRGSATGSGRNSRYTGPSCP